MFAILDADGSRKFSHFVEGERPDGFYSKGAFGSDSKCI